MARLPIRKESLRDLAIRSKNKCAFPGCDQPILNSKGVYVAELCHIEAAEPGGQRFNPDQTDEARRSPSNLLFLCHQHHKETNDESVYSAAVLRDMKDRHEALPEVVFNIDLLMKKVEEVLAEQAVIKSILNSTGRDPTTNSNYSIVGPELQEAWTPDQGRFYETKTGRNTKFRYMMSDGWLHVEQVLEDGAVAYYEIDKNGSVRNSTMPYPINQYRVSISEEQILTKERIPSAIGTHAIRTTLKWSKGTVTEHFVGNLFAGADCQARCSIDHQSRTISVL